MKDNWIIQSGFALLLLTAAFTSHADEGELGKRCISLQHIKNVKVLGNQRILFNMKGGKQYINLLPHRCHGLKKNQPFMYRTSLSQLCDVDIITVLDSGGFGLRPMGSCGLGRFVEARDGELVPITDDLTVEGQ